MTLMNAITALLTACALLVSSGPLHAQTQSDAGPIVPCGTVAPLPTYAPSGAAPNLQTWKDTALSPPPACLRWPAERAKLIVAAAGTFRHDGDAGSLLTRFGAISRMRGLLYWSVTDKGWRPLITEASAVTSADGRQRRGDFALPEMKVGSDLFFEERDSRSSTPVIYRMRVLEAGAERLVVETVNVSAIKALFVTMFPAGSLRAGYILERREPGTWSFYGLSTTSAKANSLATMSESSHINRAAALYRHFLGIPGDRDPPAAP